MDKDYRFWDAAATFVRGRSESTPGWIISSSTCMMLVLEFAVRFGIQSTLSSL